MRLRIAGALTVFRAGEAKDSRYFDGVSTTERRRAGALCC